MAFFKVFLYQTYFNQQCVTSFTYESTGTAASVSTSFALTSAMGFIADGTGIYPILTVFDAMRGLQSDQVTYTSVLTINMYDPIDFYSTPLNSGTVGFQAGEASSPVLAYGFRTSRTRRDVRRGNRRLVGVSEADVGPGGVIDGDQAALMDVAADFFGRTLTYNDEGNTLSFSPVVLKSLRVEDPDTGKIRYQQYPTEAEQAQNVMRSILWEPQGTVRTQVSRQYGRGA